MRIDDLMTPESAELTLNEDGSYSMVEPFPGHQDLPRYGKPDVWKAGAGIGPGTWNAGALAQAQEDAVKLDVAHPSRVYRLYTKPFANLSALTARYFDRATFTYGGGLWQGQTEPSAVIEVVTDDSLVSLQKVVNLAGDIRVANAQSAVLMTWHAVSSFLVDGN